MGLMLVEKIEPMNVLKVFISNQNENNFDDISLKH